MEKLILATLILVINVQAAVRLWNEFEPVALINSETGQLQTNFRLKRINAQIAIEGTYTVIADFHNNSFDCAVNMYYSSIGNNQFRLLPYKLPKENCCKTFDTWFWKKLMEELAKRSHFVIDNTKPVCYSYNKGNYTISQFMADKEAFPKLLPPGTYKIELLIYKRKSLSSKYSFTFRLY